MLAKVRRAILERDNYQCQKCGSREDPRVHHITYASNGGTDDLENLTTLCLNCHTDIHQPDGWNAKRRAIARKQRALIEMHSRFMAALYGQETLPCYLVYGQLAVVLPVRSSQGLVQYT